MARFWIADLHLGHDLVAGKRGFSTTDEHDDVVLQQLHALPADGELFVLGDVSSGRRDEEERALTLLAAVPARMHLIAGNHDSVASVHRNGWKQQRTWLEVFDSVRDFGRVRINTAHVLMSHYPYDVLGDGLRDQEPRYSEYRLPDLGYPLIHGHTHHTAPHAGDGEPFNRMFCVSWDVHRELVPERVLNSWVAELMRQGVSDAPDRSTPDSWVVDSGE